MKTDVVLAGFGGQGMLLIGKLLSLAAMQEGKEVCWLPSYGPEMRGGTANVTVTISDEPIGSPVVSTPRAAAVMNQPSLEKFGPAIVRGGVLIINESLVKVRFDRKGIDVMYLPANDLANSIGAKRSPNVVVFGAYVGATGVVELDAARKQIRAQFGRKPQIAELNLRAFQLGVDAALEFMKTKGKRVSTPAAKKPAAKKATARKPAAKKPAAKKPAAKKAAAKKPAAKKAAAKKPAAKKRAAAKRATKKRPAAKRAAKRTNKRG